MFLKTFNKYMVGSIDKIDEVLDKIDDIFCAILSIIAFSLSTIYVYKSINRNKE